MSVTESIDAGAFQRTEQEVLLQLYGADRAMRGPTPSGPPWADAIDALTRLQLLEKRDEAGMRKLTPKGVEAAENIVRHRRKEQQGLPIATGAGTTSRAR